MENFKMKVTPEQSEVVHEVCGLKPIKAAPFLYWNGDYITWGVTRDIFETHTFPELTYAQFMAKYAPFNPNPGDVVCGERGNPYIFKSAIEASDRHFAWSNGKYLRHDSLAGPATRFATQAERDMLAEMLKKDGKRWDADKLQIEQLNRQDNAPDYSRPMPAPRIDTDHLSIAFRIFGPYTDTKNIAKMVNIILDRPELFRELEKLEKEFNHPSKG